MMLFSKITEKAMHKRSLTFLLKMSLILSLFQPTFSIANIIHTLNKQYIAYTDTGKGKPLILIHAFPTDKQLWAPQQDGLKNNFRIITLDLWGFGKSSSANGQAITMSDYADEVKQLMDQLHIQKAVIGGESMGGYVAIAFLEKYPDQVEGLVLSDTQSIADNPETKEKREISAVDILEHGTANMISGFMPKALSPNASEENKEFLKHILEAQKPDAIASALRGMALRQDISDLLANSVLPILIITGDKDTLISPQQSKNMHAIAKNSKLVVLTNAGHLSSLEQPDKWNQAVIQTFDKINL
jgi:pimeloyl-ACP methyl ester carboxylesterase